MRSQMTAEQVTPAVCHDIVAAVLSHQGDLALLRRSPLVTGDVGRWNCVTGFLDACNDPLAQALEEIKEEAGISRWDLRLLSNKVLHLEGLDGRVWRVHTFHFASQTRALTLNWENDDCAWLNPTRLNELAVVPWFADILEACDLHHSIEACFQSAI
ncbi:NUDIX domain-containing protein [Pseudomonas sp. FME51]|uniref:NUDIX domain-containing protein n=1 Tax=Pseudomonas sp. FME51 TaxID=2742609 RepID=UPI0018664594|nr:NUDIX domain-containing protein [Pseudomonas sp. FME51]